MSNLSSSVLKELSELSQSNPFIPEIQQNTNYNEEIKYLMGYIIANNNYNKQYKIALYKIRGFKPDNLFNDIDSLSSGYINFSDLNEYLNKNNIKIEKDIILLFLREYNKQENDNILNIQDFNKFLNYDIDKNKIKIGEFHFDKNEIKKNFINLIKSELNLIKEKNELLNNIKKIREFSTYEAFYKISNDKKYIDYDCLQLFLGEQYNKNEIKELLYRIDMNDDGKINYDEFQDLFFPFQEHLHLDDTNDDNFNFYKKENNDDIIIINNNSDYNINPYKDDELTEPKIINNYNNYNNNIDDDNNYDEDNSNSKSDIFLSTSQLNQKKNNEYNLNNNKYDNDNDNCIIKYDKELFKEINERLKGKNNEINDSKKYQEDLNMYNNDYKFNNNLNENNKINKLNINNQDNDENQNSKSDIFKSKSDIFKSNIFISNDNNLDQNQNIIDNQNITNNINNSSEILSKTFDKNAQYNLSIIFTEQDKIIINLFIDYIHSII